MSGVPVEPVYGPADAERPGRYPYTRGPYTDMYRSKLWTMRMFAGFGTAIDTNRRFHQLLTAGGDGLSPAFYLPTLLARDSADGRPGARIPARQRVRLRGARDACRARGRSVRAPTLVLLQRAHRLLRGDRQIPGRAQNLGAVDARTLRSEAGAVVADALPHADR